MQVGTRRMRVRRAFGFGTAPLQLRQAEPFELRRKALAARGERVADHKHLHTDRVDDRKRLRELPQYGRCREGIDPVGRD